MTTLLKPTGCKDPDIHVHYGVFLDRTKPTTGVYSLHDIAPESVLDGSEFDPDWGIYCYECGVALGEPEAGHCSACGATLDWECMDWQAGTLLWGSWRQGDGGLWEPDPDVDGAEYAAIENVNYATVQVVWSTRVLCGRMCSPCYPGQVDAQADDPDKPDAEHPQAYFAMPEWAIRTD